jgi:hypothetical protein
MLLRLWFIAIAFAAISDLSAQYSTEGFDSLVLRKPKQAKAHYEIGRTPIQEMDIKTKGIKRSPYKADQALGDVSRNIFTMLIGVHITSSQDVDYNLKAYIVTNDENLNWEVDLFCSGEMEKTSERVRNDDGSRSVNVRKKVTLFWEKGGTGIIRNKQDTIGRFVISIHPQDDSVFRNRMTGVVQTERPGKRLNNPFTFIYGTDYALAGWFQQKDLLMYFNGYEKKAWIFLDGQLSGLFQCDLDGNSVVINLGKKKAGRITPYLLFKKNLPENEIADQVRLAALSRFVHNSVNIRLFDW